MRAVRAVIRVDRNANGGGGVVSCVGLVCGGRPGGERKNLIKANDIKKLCVRVIGASLEILAYLQYQSVH
jgi:hypothetical protein